MPSYNTTIGRVYATPHDQNCWAWVNAANGWRKVKPMTSSGVTNVHACLTEARDNNATISLTTDAANEIINVYV